MAAATPPGLSLFALCVYFCVFATVSHPTDTVRKPALFPIAPLCRKWGQRSDNGAGHTFLPCPKVP